jgi:hypothetical protein
MVPPLRSLDPAPIHRGTRRVKTATTAWLLVSAAFAAIQPVPGRGDWDPGDPFKMHFPQLPDPNGWDIFFMGPANEVADDWLCTASGPVSEIHFWYSAFSDINPLVATVTAAIYADIDPGPGGFSIPGAQLWTETFDASRFVQRPYGTGLQGWAEPKGGPDFWTPENHNSYFQVNITDIENPFIQEEGTIYWLGLSVTVPEGGGALGWKTTATQYRDDATYRDLQGNWAELINPLEIPPRSLDMAFVVVPEPGLPVLAAGLAAAVLARHRRRGR